MENNVLTSHLACNLNIDFGVNIFLKDGLGWPCPLFELNYTHNSATSGVFY